MITISCDTKILATIALKLALNDIDKSIKQCGELSASKTLSQPPNNYFSEQMDNFILCGAEIKNLIKEINQ